MDESFVFTLRSNKKILLEKIVWGLYLMLTIGLIFYFIYGDFKSTRWGLYIKLGSILIGSLLYNYFKKNEKLILPFGILFSIFLSSGMYYFLGLPFAIVFILFISFVFWFVYQYSIVTVNSSNIIIKTGFAKRLIYWDTLNNVILKDSILTIDFKNDKLIQEQVQDELLSLEEEVFNNFSKKYLQ